MSQRATRIGNDRIRPLASLGLCRLDENRQPGESAVVQQAAEGLLTQAALADVFVAIDAAAARLFRIVAVKYA